MEIFESLGIKINNEWSTVYDLISHYDKEMFKKIIRALHIRNTIESQKIERMLLKKNAKRRVGLRGDNFEA
jgi:hypothetical protein